MPRAGVDLDVVRDAVAGHGLVELPSRSGGEILFGVGADHRAQAPGDFERARVGGIERRDRFEARVRAGPRSEEHTSELQSPDHLVCRLLLEKKNDCWMVWIS